MAGETKKGWDQYRNLNILRMKKKMFLDEINKKAFFLIFKGYYLLIKKTSWQSLITAWPNYKKGINLISWLVLQNEHAMFVWWGPSVFISLKSYHNTEVL